MLTNHIYTSIKAYHHCDNNYKTTLMIVTLEEKGLLTCSKNPPKLLDVVANSIL